MPVKVLRTVRVLVGVHVPPELLGVLADDDGAEFVTGVDVMANWTASTAMWMKPRLCYQPIRERPDA